MRAWGCSGTLPGPPAQNIGIRRASSEKPASLADDTKWVQYRSSLVICDDVVCHEVMNESLGVLAPLFQCGVELPNVPWSPTVAGSSVAATAGVGGNLSSDVVILVANCDVLSLLELRSTAAR